jgi:hypothetical protein
LAFYSQEEDNDQLQGPGQAFNERINEQNIMEYFLYIIAIILLVLWVLGFFILNAGGFIHIFLIAALAVFMIRVMQARRII